VFLFHERLSNLERSDDPGRVRPSGPIQFSASGSAARDGAQAIVPSPGITTGVGEAALGASAELPQGEAPVGDEFRDVAGPTRLEPPGHRLAARAANRQDDFDDTGAGSAAEIDRGEARRQPYERSKVTRRQVAEIDVVADTGSEDPDMRVPANGGLDHVEKQVVGRPLRVLADEPALLIPTGLHDA
jgi:hypothetical protein